MKLKLTHSVKQSFTCTGQDFSINKPQAMRICVTPFAKMLWVSLNATLVCVAAALISLLALSTSARATGSSLQTEQLRAELIAYAPQGISPGQTFWLGLKLSHQPQWHTYWKNPGDSGLPTQLSWELPRGLKAQEVLWPIPRKLYVSNLTNYGFEGEVLLVTPITVSASSNFLGSTIDIGLHANWLICKQECIPQEGDFRLKVPLKSSSALDATDFLNILDHQPIELSKPKQFLEINGNKLTGQIRGLSKEFMDFPMILFPELSEIVADPKPEVNPNAASPIASNSGLNLEMQLHHMRSTKPSYLGALIVFQTPKGPVTYHTTFQIKGAWPGPDTLDIVSTNSKPIQDNISNPTLGSTPDIAPSQTLTNPGFLNIFATHPFIAALLGALLGGMILNLMPCVLPILAIKVLSLAVHSQNKRLYRRHIVGYALGVIFCFSLLGGLVVGLKTIGLELGWGFQLQSPTAVAGLSFLFLLIALNLLGTFQIHFVVPNRLLMLQSKEPGVDGFLSGLLSVVVAAPCTAPFMGASLGWAVTAANWQGMFIFACLGLGMALPILAISYAPALGKLLPKPGAWMNTMRVFLAFPMLLTITWLLWVFGQQLGLNEMALLIVALITFSALTFCSKLVGRSKLISAIFFAILLIGEYGVGQSLVASNQNPSPNATRPPASKESIQSLPGNLNWEIWSPELVQQSLAMGRPVFVDFTAAWCITCQVNERTTLQNETIKSLLLSKNVRLLRADWTQPNEQIASTLAGLGRNGIPVYLLLSPQKQQVMLSELLNANELARELSKLSP